METPRVIRCLVCRALLVLLAPAAVGHAQTEDASRDCAEVARTYLEIDASPGVYTEQAVAVAPLRIKVPTGVDARLKTECLKVAGQDPGAKMTAEFERAEACRQAARELRITASSGDDPARIGGGFDTAAYATCLSGDIEVDVLDDE